MPTRLLEPIWRALGGAPEDLDDVVIAEAGALPSVFDVTGLAAASVGVAGAAAAGVVAAIAGGARPAVRVDARLASLWFGMTIEPRGWTLPPPWDPLAGDYPASDGWVKLHTNAPRHRAAALRALGVPAERDAVACVVAARRAGEVEAEVVAAGGCAAEMRSIAAWAEHPQGRAVAAEPLLAFEATRAGPPPARLAPSLGRPLAGLRVLDLTRVLAGPVATRFLAGLGADVLRIDPLDWDEPGVVPEVTLGKRCARLDLTTADGRERLVALLGEADVLVHGYRPGALEHLGLGADVRAQTAPNRVEVTLDAYGWTGAWAGRRGFDSLVQMSAGVADAGMRAMGSAKPVPLPVQALDHATGYLLAAAALRGLASRLAGGPGLVARASLARTAALLVAGDAGSLDDRLEPASAADYARRAELTAWGLAGRLRPPVEVAGTPLRWDGPAVPLGSAEARWVPP